MTIIIMPLLITNAVMTVVTVIRITIKVMTTTQTIGPGVVTKYVAVMYFAFIVYLSIMKFVVTIHQYLAKPRATIVIKDKMVFT